MLLVSEHKCPLRPPSQSNAPSFLLQSCSQSRNTRMASSFLNPIRKADCNLQRCLASLSYLYPARRVNRPVPLRSWISAEYLLFIAMRCVTWYTRKFRGCIFCFVCAIFCRQVKQQRREAQGRGHHILDRRHQGCKIMGIAILFPKFLRKLHCIRWSHQKQDGGPIPPL